MSNREPEGQRELLDKFNAAISGTELDDLRRLAEELLPTGHDPAAGPRRSSRRPRRKDTVTYRIRVDLEGARPPIWRRLDVRSDVTLDVVHQVLQAAFGWEDSHLHRFALGESVFDRDAETFLCPWDVEEGDDEGLPASKVRLDETLGEPGDVLRYCYDYGDSWDLALKLEEVLPAADESTPVAVCVDGRRAAPPEDCGGLRDAEELAGVLADPAHFDVDEVNQALTDPFVQLLDAGVDPRVHQLLVWLRGTALGDELVIRTWGVTVRRTLASDGEREVALEPYLWFLDHVGEEGLPLTAAGYLKPVDVTAAAAVVPDGLEWIGAKSREIDTYPVLMFRERLQQLGLLRKHKGRLLLTRAGAASRDNPDRLWSHLAARLPLGSDKDASSLAGLMALVFMASTPDLQPPPYARIGEALTYLGWRDAAGRPIDERTATHAASATVHALQSLTTGPRRPFGRRQLSPVGADLAAAALFAAP